MTANLRYNWSDAWLLLAVIYANKNGRGTLDRIIAAGDLINHAIFSAKECESGLSRLTTGGYITQKDLSFVITDQALEIARRLSQGSGIIQKELKEIELVLGISRQQRPSPNNLKHAGFLMAGYRAALKKHVATFGRRPEKGEDT